MNVIFTSNWQKTELFAPVAKVIEKQGFNVYWLVTSPQYKKWLLDQGFHESKILHVRRDEALEVPDDKVDYTLLREIEFHTQDTIKHLVLMDRIVGHWPWAESEKYSAYLAQKIQKLILEKDIALVMGEPDTLHELIAVQLCKMHNRIYVGPLSLRLPVTRFMFWLFRDEKEWLSGGPRSMSDVGPEWIEMAREIRDKVTTKREKPAYWYQNKKAPKLSAKFIGKVFRGVHRAAYGAKVDGNMYSLKNAMRIQRLHLRPYFYRTAKLKWDAIFDRIIPGEKFVLYTLSKQPELTIDVLSARFSNQLEVIRNITRHLPVDTMLYVKEHQNSLGDRSVRELMAIKNLPGVRLIDPTEDIHDCIKASELVVTAAGTASLEAALYGKPSYTLADSFMNGFSTCRQIQGPWEIAQKLIDPGVKFDPDHDLRYLAHILACSYPGQIATPVTAPNVVSEENVQNIAAGFKDAIEANLLPKKSIPSESLAKAG